ncbi:MAG: hypothetical protein ACTSYH_03490 [Candidatus Heimdallarchaeaceae archaeon]
MSRSIVLIPSVQHSGTRFIESLLANSSSNNVAMQLWNKLPVCFELINKSDSGIKNYAKSFGDLIFLIESKLYEINDDNGIVVIQFHIGETNTSFISNAAAVSLSRLYPCAIPIRDPLLSLLTRHVRSSCLDDFNLFYIITAFSFLSNLGGKSESRFFPIDLLGKLSIEERIEIVTNFFQSINFVPENGFSYVDYWVGNWSPLGSTSSYNKKYVVEKWTRLMDAYNNRDVAIIRSEIPSAFLYLKSTEKVNRPFLESLGYSNLLWWD